jgi:hypothetical protein
MSPQYWSYSFPVRECKRGAQSRLVAWCMSLFWHQNPESTQKCTQIVHPWTREHNLKRLPCGELLQKLSERSSSLWISLAWPASPSHDTFLSGPNLGIQVSGGMICEIAEEGKILELLDLSSGFIHFNFRKGVQKLRPVLNWVCCNCGKSSHSPGICPVLIMKGSSFLRRFSSHIGRKGRIVSLVPDCSFILLWTVLLRSSVGVMWESPCNWWSHSTCECGIMVFLGGFASGINLWGESCGRSAYFWCSAEVQAWVFLHLFIPVASSILSRVVAKVVAIDHGVLPPIYPSTPRIA